MSAALETADSGAEAPSPLYVHRPRALGQEIAFRLDPRHLFVGTGRGEEQIPYARIARIRLTYEPNNFIWNSYRATLTLTDGRKLKIANISFRGYVQVETHDAAYRAFVGQLLVRAAQANPRLVCVAGKPAFIWWIMALAGGLLLAGIVAALGGALAQGSWAGALLSAFILAGFGGLFGALTVKNRPHAFLPAHPPASVLPRAPV